MPRPPSPSIPEKSFLLTAIQSSLRIDGRNLLELRQPQIQFFDHVLGKVQVSAGKTVVLAHVSGKLVKPPPERPFEGILTIHSEISPMAGWEDYEGLVGRPSEEEVILTRMLDKVLRRSDAIDKESLCILAAQRVWHLTLTIHALADAGNLLDVAVLAGMLALKHYRRPEVDVRGNDEVIVHPPTERAPLPLSINHTPYCFTFVLFPPARGKVDYEDKDPVVVLDPSSLEAKLCDGKISIALNAQKELVVVQKSGGMPLTQEQIQSIIDVAVARVKDLDAFVTDQIWQDWEGRRQEVEFR